MSSFEEGRFVHIDLRVTEKITIPTWVVVNGRNEGMLIWSEDMAAAYNEFGHYEAGLIDPDETDTMVDAEETTTPDEAWVALARFRLLGREAWINALEAEYRHD